LAISHAPVGWPVLVDHPPPTVGPGRRPCALAAQKVRRFTFMFTRSGRRVAATEQSLASMPPRPGRLAVALGLLSTPFDVPVPASGSVPWREFYSVNALGPG
jgi:hypothetical protein